MSDSAMFCSSSTADCRLAAGQVGQRQGGLLAGVGRIEPQRLGEVLFGLLRVAVLQVGLAGDREQARIEALLAHRTFSVASALAGWPERR